MITIFFFSTISDPNLLEKKQPIEDMDEVFKINSPTNAIKEIKLTDDEEDDPFSLDNEKKVNNTSSNPVSVSIQPSISSNTIKEDSFYSLKKQTSISNHNFNNDKSIDEADEDRDKFLEIKLSDPTKVGDGMGSYMVYKLTTKTNYPVFKSQEFSATRRFSDFLSLYEKLKEKHLQTGRILPPAPEKDMIGMAKVKMSKEDTTPIDFIEKRRATLERFLNRLACHKVFRYDPDFRDFLEISTDLPKASNTSALSGAGMLKMFKNVTESVSKIAVKMEETDQWFEEKTRQVENLYVQFKKMHGTIEMLCGWRRDLTSSTKEFSKSAAILANSEEQLNLSRALCQLGEIYEKIEQIYLEQSNADYFVMSELVKDYVCLFDNIKEIFYQRVKIYSIWQKSEETLKSKKDAKAKFEQANKQDKIPAALAEIKDWESKVDKAKEEFEQISKNIKEEVKRFDFERAKEFKVEITKYLQTLLNNQEQLVKIWEAYREQVKAI
jgi:sorting nexin-1/2